jgi:hypothetical protein
MIALPKRTIWYLNFLFLFLVAWFSVLTLQEKTLYENYIYSVLGDWSDLDDEQRLLKLVQGIHASLSKTRQIASSETPPPLKQWFNSADYALLYPTGGDADFAKVFVVAAGMIGLESRIIYLKDHVAAETKLGDRWVFVDPQFGFTVRHGKRLATVDEIRGNWAKLKAQVAPKFVAAGYSFSEVAKTNWGKAPMMPLLRTGFERVKGERWAAELSLETSLARTYRVWVGVVVVFAVVVNFFAGLRALFRLRGAAAPSTASPSRPPALPSRKRS